MTHLLLGCLYGLKEDCDFFQQNLLVKLFSLFKRYIDGDLFCLTPKCLPTQTLYLDGIQKNENCDLREIL